LINSPQSLKEKTMNYDQKLKEYLEQNDLQLPPPPKSIGIYKPALVIGNLCYTSGHLPIKGDGSKYLGGVGHHVDVETAQEAARQAGLAILATLQSHLGTLNRIDRVVKLLGMVNCVDSFTQQPQVMNGCSQVMVDIFGADKGIGARSAIGVNALPAGVTIEVEGIFLLKDGE